MHETQLAEQPRGLSRALIERYLWPLSWLGFLLITLLCRAPSLRAPIGEDAADYLYVGRLIFDGSTPYADAGETRSPATPVLYGAIDLVTGSSATGVRLALALSASVTALLLARWVARSAGLRTGLIAGALFASLGTLLVYDGVDPNTEQFGVLFMVGAVLLASSGTTLAAAGAGALCGWAILMNPGFAPIVLLAGFELLRANREAGRRAILVAAVAFGAGMVAIAVPFAVWLGLAGALGDLKTQVWDYSRMSATAHTLVSPPPTKLTDLHHLFDIPARGLWIAGAAGALFAIALRGPARRIGVSALLWIVLSWLRVKFNHGFEYGHHYYVGMPGIVAGIAAGIGALLDIAPRRAGLALAAVLLAVPLWFQVARPQLDDLKRPSYDRANSVRAAHAYPIADVIRRVTPPGSKIFVAGSEPEIYWLTNRTAPTRWFANYELFIFPRFSKERDRQLRADPPAAIALLAPETLTDVDGSLEKLIADLNYQVVWHDDWGTVWVRS